MILILLNIKPYWCKKLQLEKKGNLPAGEKGKRPTWRKKETSQLQKKENVPTNVWEEAARPKKDSRMWQQLRTLHCYGEKAGKFQGNT